ncbi:methylmalonyl-CoA epimerase [Tumebacillus sp. DT12]|uniref:Methylmalonyl-CoA epimerase n=1 Tax=Tumebacillus lacus TaxID=2995335 RepID=A0ABT3X0M2_9BACL|nr:methylmalonyl-CoA epimerase [Tumebacillus lacus]MCX7569151.1 methylmalonyl-CoA epimerase [Tumebacillus lacus]
MFRPEKIDHLGIAVHSIEATLPIYTNGIGLPVIHEEIIEDQKVRAVFLEVGESCVELLEPTSPDSPIAKFLETKGQGIHHVAYAVENIEAALAHAKEQGYRLIDEKPRKGGHGKMIAFLHPKDTHGVLTEFCMRIED